jgi:hypothetical protein
LARSAGSCCWRRRCRWPPPYCSRPLSRMACQRLADANPWWRAAVGGQDSVAWTVYHPVLKGRAAHDLGFRAGVLEDIQSGPVTDQLAILTGPRRIGKSVALLDAAAALCARRDVDARQVIAGASDRRPRGRPLGNRGHYRLRTDSERPRSRPGTSYGSVSQRPGHHRSAGVQVGRARLEERSPNHRREVRTGHPRHQVRPGHHRKRLGSTSSPAGPADPVKALSATSSVKRRRPRQRHAPGPWGHVASRYLRKANTMMTIITMTTSVPMPINMSSSSHCGADDS